MSMFNILIDDQIVSRILVSVGILLGTLVVSIVIKKAIDLVFKEIRRAIISGHFIAKTKAARTLLIVPFFFRCYRCSNDFEILCKSMTDNARIDEFSW